MTERLLTARELADLLVFASGTIVDWASSFIASFGCQDQRFESGWKRYGYFRPE